jgi:SDR family mycofactocin-dependent oxidoreductase
MLENKVAFITGAGRGQGRSHAVHLASLGADIIALDVCEDVVETNYGLATSDDLQQTVDLVKATGRRIHVATADVRSLAQVQKVADEGLGIFGKIDIVSANAGIGAWGVSWELSEQAWRDMIDVNLTGVFNTVRATVPSMVERGEGGCVVLTSSTAGLIGYQNTAHYTAAKHGVIGLMKVLSQELGPHNIRVNAVCPTSVNTPMIINQTTFELFAPDVASPGPDDVKEPFAGLNSLAGVPWIEPVDVSQAIAWLASDQAKYVTGIALPIDAGNTSKK